MEGFDWVRGAIFPYINFLIFLSVAIWGFRKPLQAMAEKRRAELDALIAASRKAKDEAEKQNAELQQRLSRLDAELSQLRTAVTEDAEREAKQIVEQAENLARHLKEEAKRVAETEVEAAKAALRQDIVQQVRAQVESRISQEIKPDAHMQIVAKQIASLKNMRAEA